MGYAYIIAGALSVVILLIYLASKKFREPDLKILLLIPSLVFGFMLYLVGYLPILIGMRTAEPMRFGGVMSGLFRALASTVQMLGGENAYEVISKNGAYFGSFGYMIPFWVTHFVAVLVTIMAAVTVFGRTLASKFRQLRHYAADTYVIYGVNTKSLCLGQSIMLKSCDPRDKTKRFVVFIDENADQTSRAKISKMGAVIVGEPIFSCNKLNMKALLKAGLTNRRKRMYFFAFTDSDVLNFSIASGIWDAVIDNRVSPVKLNSIFVYTDRSAITSELEAKKYNFNYFSDEELASRILFDAHPLYKRLVFDSETGLPNDAIHKPVITVVILGFQSLGRQILRQALSDGQFEGSAFKAVILDKQTGDAMGIFVKKYPALFDKQSCRDIDISFYNEAPGSAKTYETLDALLRKNGGIDYIIACLGDDDLNFTVISDLRRYLMKNAAARANMPVLAAHITDKKYQLFTKEEETIGKINVFGDYDTLFSHRIIVNEEMDVLAKTVDKVAYGGTNWSALSVHNKNSNRAAASYIGAYLYMMGLEMASEEDEKKLLEKAVRYEVLTSEQFGALLKNNELLLENLGRSEHRRWNAFHYARGWERKMLGDVASYDDRKDQEARTHACLVDWEDLGSVRDHIVEASEKAGLSQQRLEDIKRSCDFEQIDKNNISKIFDILTTYNRQVSSEKQLTIIRRV